MQTYHDTIQDAEGNIITIAVVTVYDAGTGTPSNIYAENETTSLNNPFTISDSNYDTDGSFWFKADNGVYDIKVVSGAITDWKKGIVLDGIEGEQDGAMIVHDAARKAFFSFQYAVEGVVSYRKIATLPIPSGTGAHVRMLVSIDRHGGGYDNELDIYLATRDALIQKVYSLKSGNTLSLSKAGIRTYVETDNSLSVYIYDDGTDWANVSVKLVSTGLFVLATIIPPNKVISITDPTSGGGTLSLDTTAAPYKNGVPDGNEDLNDATLLNGWSVIINYDAVYARNSNGIIDIRFGIEGGTTISGTILFTLPVGYRPSKLMVIPFASTGAGLAANARILIDTSGNFKVYSLGTAIDILCDTSFKAEQ
jgi:hypothetical protein